MKSQNKRISAQQFQDEIFHRMSTEERLAFGVQLWQLAKEVTKRTQFYDHSRSR